MPTTNATGVSFHIMQDFRAHQELSWGLRCSGFVGTELLSIKWGQSVLNRFLSKETTQAVSALAGRMVAVPHLLLGVPALLKIWQIRTEFPQSESPHPLTYWQRVIVSDLVPLLGEALPGIGCMLRMNPMRLKSVANVAMGVYYVCVAIFKRESQLTPLAAPKWDDFTVAECNVLLPREEALEKTKMLVPEKSGKSTPPGSAKADSERGKEDEEAQEDLDSSTVQTEVGIETEQRVRNEILDRKTTALNEHVCTLKTARDTVDTAVTNYNKAAALHNQNMKEYLETVDQYREYSRYISLSTRVYEVVMGPLCLVELLPLNETNLQQIRLLRIALVFGRAVCHWAFSQTGFASIRANLEAKSP